MLIGDGAKCAFGHSVLVGPDVCNKPFWAIIRTIVRMHWRYWLALLFSYSASTLGTSCSGEGSSDIDDPFGPVAVLRIETAKMERPVGMSSMAISPATYSVGERVVNGDASWVVIRARGAEWSWLTAQEAAEIGRTWVKKYGCDASDPSLVTG